MSGNPAGRPPARRPEGAVEAALAGIGRSGGDGLAVNLARVLAGKSAVIAPSAPEGDCAWFRLLRTVPDEVLDQLDALPAGEVAALAASLGYVEGMPYPPLYPGQVRR